MLLTGEGSADEKLTPPGGDRAGKGTPAAIMRLGGNILLGMLLLLVILLAIFMVLGRAGGDSPAILGYRFYVVLSGSMEPACRTGSLILVRSLDPEAIEKGDIITFKGSRSGSVTTHRVVEIEREGGLAFVTRGDANNVNDPSAVPAENIIGRVRGSLPLLGYLLAFARTRLGLICLVFIPGTLLIAGGMRNIYLLYGRRKKVEDTAS